MEGAVTDDFLCTTVRDFHPRDAWLTDLRKPDPLDVSSVFVSGACRQLEFE